MATRALITLPAGIRRGDVIDIRTLVQHPMESGYRVDAQGQPLARDIIRRVEARLDGVLVFSADLHQAIAANPSLAFALRAAASGTLTVTWQGDNGFVHSERVQVVVA